MKSHPTSTKVNLLRAACAVLALGVALPAIAAAPARDWTILNFGSGQSVRAKISVPLFPTPDLFHKELRREGVVDSVDVSKDDDGTVARVSITTNQSGNGVTLMWFPDKAHCEIMRAIATEKGIINNTEDLQ